MTTKFKELDLSLIQQGEVLEAFNRQFNKVQRQITKFIEKHGEAAKGASAGIVLKVDMKVEDPASKMVSLVPEIKLISPPVMPKKKTFAIGAKNDTDQNILYVGVTGSHEESPAQGVFPYQKEEEKGS